MLEWGDGIIGKVRIFAMVISETLLSLGMWSSRYVFVRGSFSVWIAESRNSLFSSRRLKKKKKVFLSNWLAGPKWMAASGILKSET